MECDDLYKANNDDIKRLFEITKGRFTKNKYKCTLKDVVEMLKQAGFTGPEHEKNGTIAFSLSKMTIEDEMEDFDRYDRMVHVEFIEFLSRASELMFEGNQPLVQKL